VADPAKGSRHNRGAAVDLTLIKLDGTELPMPTPFDDFTPKAQRDCMDLPPEVIKNRELLERVMTEHNFIGLETEWWHFDLRNARKYEILDIDYSQIK
jgi:D-alanyl-D-alanine dipeptidase